MAPRAAWCVVVGAIVVIGGGCAGGAGPEAGSPVPGNSGRPVPADSAQRMVPAGYGTLRQDDATVALRTGNVQVKLTPLDEATIRLLAPDTYARLHALRESRRAEASRNMPREPELFLVSFFSYQPDESFQPEDVQLVHQARLLRAGSIVPVTTGWGRQRLGQQETQSAIYAFEGPIEYDQAITVRYGPAENSDWTRIITVLETERAKIVTRLR
jgi:hypothetical protein